MNKITAPLLDSIKKHMQKKRIPFHVPAHLGKVPQKIKEISKESFFALDLTELPDLDDLHCPTGPLQESQRLAAEFFNAQKTFFLVNGVTGGILASHLHYGGEGKKILLPRNAHKSNYSGLILSGSTPVYLPVNYQEGIPLNIDMDDVEKALNKHSDATALFITSPGYHGECTDLAKLREMTTKRGVSLVVDEAHGTHFILTPKLPLSASEVGADLWLQSTHKTGGALTQGGMLHVGNKEREISQLAINLNLIQTSSPSYLIMASLDEARRRLAAEGKEMVEEVILWSRKLRKKLLSFSIIKLMNLSGFEQDPLRLTLSTSLKLKGERLRELLNEEGIEVELTGECHILLILSLFHAKEDIDFLEKSLEKIEKKLQKEKQELVIPFTPLPLPRLVLPPREAMQRKSTTLPTKDTLGKIAAEMVVPYPPGIPLLAPGEEITTEVLERLQELKDNGNHCQAADPSLNYLKIVTE